MFAQGLSGRVLDFDTKKPIPFATIQYAKNRGVITNDEGFFTINIPAASLNDLTISSMGYQTQELSSSKIENDLIYLKSQVIQLDDVFLTDKKLSGREILEKAKENVAANYRVDAAKKRFFFRESNLNKVKRFDLEIQESSIEDINQALMDSLSGSIPKSSDSYKEVLGDFTGDYSKQEVEIIKAANLYNPQSTSSLDKITDKLDRIFRENVKKDSYLKIKSGIFGVKVDADEIAEDKEEMKQAKEEKEPTEEEIAKSETEKRKYLISSTNTHIASLLRNMFWKEDGVFDLFDRLNRYEYKVKGYTYLDNELVYVIDFEPKGRSDFRGKVFVNTEDYGVHRIDFTNVKPLKKFRLLGISTVDDVYRGKMIFSKDESGHYFPKYLEKEKGESFGIDRPLKLVEKNKNVIGRRKQNELDMDIFINVSQLNKYQLVVYDGVDTQFQPEINRELSTEFDYQTFKKYDPEFWKGYNIIEPNAAIKEFTAIQAE